MAWGESMSISQESQQDLLRALCPMSYFIYLDMPDRCWVPQLLLVAAKWHAQGWAKLSAVTETPLSHTCAHVEVESSKATGLWLLWGCSATSLWFPSLGAERAFGLLHCMFSSSSWVLSWEDAITTTGPLKTSKTLAMVAFVNIGGCCVRCWKAQPQHSGVSGVTVWWVLPALPVLSMQPFNCLGDEDWLACALAFSACKLGLVSVAFMHCPHLSWPEHFLQRLHKRNGRCGICTREMARFQPGPVVVESAMLSFTVGLNLLLGSVLLSRKSGLVSLL